MDGPSLTWPGVWSQGFGAPELGGSAGCGGDEAKDESPEVSDAWRS
jgi:hypothetical protein